MITDGQQLSGHNRASIVSVGIGGDSDSGDESVTPSTRW